MTGEPEQGQTDPDNPWPGLAAYSEQASIYFYGRGDEVGELLRRVRRHLLTVLFGQSGLGKTSLLQAGLFPRLRAERFLPVAIRLDFSPGAAGLVDQVKTRIQQVIVESGLIDAPVPGTEETLWAYFHRRDVELRGAEGQLLVLVLVFDQLEEIFTLGEGGRTSASHIFLTELSDLVENRPPTEVEQRIEADLDAAEQFEFGKEQYRILLSLREDYLPHLEDLRVSMPSLTQNRMRLNRMTDLQAVDAVVRPGGDLVSPSLAQEIVRFVSGAKSKEGSYETARIEVEPSLLSLVCHELNNKRRALRQSTITPDLLAGSSDAILQDFYERCLSDQVAAVRRFVEDQLLTDSGFRESIALERARKVLEQQGAPPAAVDQLIDRRLLHVEERLNVRRVELTHDILTGVVKASRDSRRAREEKEEVEQQRKLAEEQRRQAEERERRTRRELRRARITAAAFGILLVAALVAAGWAILADREAKRETKRAVEAERAAIQQKELAQRTAIQLRERGLDYNSTIVAMAEKLIQDSTPEDALMIHVVRARALSLLGRHQEAIDEYTELLKTNPGSVMVWTSLGYEYINVRDYPKALQATSFALEHSGESLPAFLNKGFLLGAQGDYDGAARAMKEGIAKFPYAGVETGVLQSTISPDITAATGQSALYVDEIEARNAGYYELANLKAYAGDPSFAATLEAADAYPTSVAEVLFALNLNWRQLENRPQDYGALAAEGALWERAGFKDWAKELYTRFQHTHADKRAAQYNDLAKWVDKRLESLRDVSFPVPTTPEPSVLALEAQELAAGGNLTKARERLDQAVAQQPENIELLISRAWFFVNHDQYREAIKDCDAIATHAPRTAVAYLIRAIAKQNLSQTDPDIEKDLRKAIECDPHFELALVRLSDRLGNRDPKEALELLDDSLKEGLGFNDAPYVYWRVAYLQNNLRRYREAAEAARLAIAMKSNVLNFYEPLYNAEQGLGNSLKDVTGEVATFCREQAEARSVLGQKWNAFSTYWTGIAFLAGKSKGSNAVDVRPEIISLVSGVSDVLESIESKQQAIIFWNAATEWFKAFDQTFTEEAFLESIDSKQQAIIFWNTLVKSNHLKGYNQIFIDEMNRLSATRGSGASVQ